MRLLLGILFCVLIVPVVYAHDITDRRRRQLTDTINHESYTRANEFFDALQERSRQSKFTNFIVNSIVVNNDWTGHDAKEAEKKLVDETAYFETFEGKTIANIYIVRNDVYGDSLGNFFTRAIDAIHYMTREHVIRKYLLFKKGDVVVPGTMVHNEEVLRALNFISDAYILVQPSDSRQYPDMVDVFVYSRDHWSINLGLDQKTSGEYGYWAYDDNFLGLGHRLTLGSYFRTSAPHFQGYILGYDVKNMFGSFFNVGLSADMSYEQYRYEGRLEKHFIRPTDFALGALYRMESVKEGLLLEDTALPVNRQIIDLWGGVSIKLKQVKSSLFLTGRWFNRVYHERALDVGPWWNPYYQNTTIGLAAVGLYRESFYRGNHIFGFATSEDIPYGYKLELTTGHSWGEFYNCFYLGTKLSAGQLFTIGFISGELSYGSYFDPSWEAQQTAVSARLMYFTNLFRLGEGSLRNFIRLDYTTGLNRLEGEREKVAFGNNLRCLSLPAVTGLNRMLINLEAVYFSPVYFYNFRFAFYAFSDMGWLGDDYRMFVNDFYLTCGGGVRIKNDRLFFTSIQLQLGYAVINPGGGSSSWFSLGSEPGANLQRYTPDKPEPVFYQ